MPYKILRKRTYFSDLNENVTNKRRCNSVEVKEPNGEKTANTTMVPTVVNQNSPNQQNIIQPGTKKVFLSKSGKIIGAQLVHQPSQTNANSANDTGKIAISALSFYRSKIILDHPKCFGRVQIVLVGCKSFWLILYDTFLD